MVAFPLGCGTAEVIVIGGAVAGAATAAHLAAAGIRVLLLERASVPVHKVCGEFISPDASAMLAELGIDLTGAAPIEHVRLSAGAGRADAPLPFRALGFSRRLLDERLLMRAEALGAEVRRGVMVRAVAEGGGVALADGSVFGAERIVLATGKHDLRGAGRPRGTMLGLKMHFAKVPADLVGKIELRLLSRGYAGLAPLENGRLNLCVALERDGFESWPALLAALRMEGAEPLWPRPLAVAAIPYGYRHRGEGPAYRVGDQLAVIPSFVGDGIAIALRSARRVAEAIVAGTSPATIHASLATELAPQFRRARMLGWVLARPRLAVAAARLLPRLLASAASATRLRFPM